MIQKSEKLRRDKIKLNNNSNNNKNKKKCC